MSSDVNETTYLDFDVDLYLNEQDLALAVDILRLPNEDTHDASNNEGPPQQPTTASDPTLAVLEENLNISSNHDLSSDISGFQGLEPIDATDLQNMFALAEDIPDAPTSVFHTNNHSAFAQPQPADLHLAELLETQGTDWVGYISSYEEHLRFKDEYMRLNNGPARGNVLDFPHSNHGQKELVRQLYIAMRNMDDILDGTRLCRKRRRLAGDVDADLGEVITQDRFEDSVAVRRVKETSAIELEMLSWDLLFAIRDAQLGQDFIPRWSKDWERRHYSNFTDRFNAVILSLANAKTVVSSLLNVSFMKRLAAAPERELHRKKDNKRLNLDRDVSVKAGNYARKRGLVDVNKEDKSIKAADGYEIAPPNPLSSRLVNDASNRRRQTVDPKAQGVPRVTDNSYRQGVAFTSENYWTPHSQIALPSQSPAVTTPTTLGSLRPSFPVVQTPYSTANPITTPYTESPFTMPTVSAEVQGLDGTDYTESSKFNLSLFPWLSQNFTDH